MSHKPSGGLSRQGFQASRDVVSGSMIQSQLTPLQTCDRGKAAYGPRVASSAACSQICSSHLRSRVGAPKFCHAGC